MYMLKSEDERLSEFYEIGINNDKYNIFTDAFGEFIHEMNNVDLSEETKQHLYDIFIKDMIIYHKNAGLVEKVEES